MSQYKLSSKVNGLFIFLIVFLSIIYTFPRWADPNQNSRLDMVFAVVEDGSFQIDRFVWNTVDYAKVGDHYYSDKAPGTALLGIPIYAGLKQLLDLPAIDSLTQWLAQSASFQATLREEGTGVSLEKVRFAITQIVLVVFLAAIPTALLSVVLFNYLGRFSQAVLPRAIVALSYGLLTPAWAYGGALYGHQLSAFLIFTSFWGLSAGWFDGNRVRAFGLGLLLAFSIVIEYPSVIAVVIIGAYALVRFLSHRAFDRSLFFFLGGILPGLGLMAYNNAVFGGPFALGYAYSELWLDQHQSGFMSLGSFQLEAVWGIFFSGYRGLFFFSPWLLTSVVGFYFWWSERIERPAFLISLAVSILFIVFNASSVMWWGGFAIGPRYLLPALPFLAIPVIFTLLCFRKIAWFKVLFTLSLLWSFLATWGLALAGQAFPSDVIREPFFEYAIPAWSQGDIARNFGYLLNLRGAWSLLPLFAILLLLILGWFRWTKKHSLGSSSEPGRKAPLSVDVGAA
jgi:hypothetical protein